MVFVYVALTIVFALIIIFLIVKKRKRIKTQLCIGCIIALLIILIIPFLINEAYMVGLRTDRVYKTLWDAKEVLAFYGSFLSFLGTASLGVLALLQNHKFKIGNDKAQERLERINENLLELDSSREKEKLFERYFSYLDETNKLFNPEYCLGNFREPVDIISVFYKIKGCQLNLLAQKRRLMFLDDENSSNEFFQYIDEKANEMMKIVAIDADDEQTDEIVKSLFEFWTHNYKEHNLKSLEFISKIHNSIYRKKPQWN